MTALLSDDVIDIARRSVLCWLATVDRHGQPNVSPKEVFAPFDEQHLVIAHIASPGSVRNLRARPAACVSFIDIFAQRGYKLRGQAHVLDRHDPEFPHWSAPLLAMAGTRFPIAGTIVLAVESVEPIIAPSYRLYPDQTSEQSQIEAACRTYGVRLQPRVD